MSGSRLGLANGHRRRFKARVRFVRRGIRVRVRSRVKVEFWFRVSLGVRTRRGLSHGHRRQCKVRVRLVGPGRVRIKVRIMVRVMVSKDQGED